MNVFLFFIAPAQLFDFLCHILWWEIKNQCAVCAVGFTKSVTKINDRRDGSASGIGLFSIYYPIGWNLVISSLRSSKSLTK